MPSAVELLVRGLVEAGNDRKKIGQVMNACPVGESDLESYCHFSEDCYQRNLVHRTDDFELILLCWGPTQCSPIHDHADSECWMRVVAGEITETLYEISENSKGKEQMTKLKERALKPGSVAHINNSIGLHCIANSYAGPSMTLHLYAPAIEICHYYHPETCTEKSRVMKYHTTPNLSV